MPGLFSYFFPSRSVKRAIDQVAFSASNIVKAADSARRLSSDGKDGQSAKESEEAWHRMSSKEKWLYAYEVGQWDEEALTLQRGSISLAKWIFLLAAILMPVAITLVVVSVPIWISAFLVPALLFFTAFAVVQFLRHAWWICQIDLRDMISFRDFLRRKDAVLYMFGGWR